MRVSQRMMYQNFLGNMNSSLADLVESNIQSSSQKQINRPSDDPVGMARVLNYRASLGDVGQYKKNVDTAKGWLNLADSTLTSVSTVLTRIKGLAEQAATSTVSPENRKQISFELRQQYEQLINLANTKFENRHIFAGHKYDEPPFVQGLQVTTNDPNLKQAALPAGEEFSVEGASPTSIMVQFLDSGTVGGATPLDYRFSADGGTTWQTGTLAAAATSIDLGTTGVRLNLPNGATMTAATPPDPVDADNGSLIYIRPTALYRGDDNDLPPQVDSYGATAGTTAQARGTFTSDVLVKVTNTGGVDIAAPPANVSYSYSIDGGNNWVGATATTSTANQATLSLPGGFLTIDVPAADTTLDEGQQFLVRPRRADLGFEVSEGEYITVNSVGKDIFGGIYKNPLDPTATAQPVGGGTTANMFETVGRLIAFAETNNQDGVQKCLDELNGVSKTILTAAASVGGRENRLEVVSGVLDNQKMDQTSRMSAVEDVNFSELMTRLAQEQLIYNSVLKSSSMIMQMNLSNFL